MKNMKIIDLILSYIIQPNTITEDDIAQYIEVQTDGKFTAEDFHDWIAKFDVDK